MKGQPVGAMGEVEATTSHFSQIVEGRRVIKILVDTVVFPTPEMQE
jgi:hypothetical protein